MNIPFSIISSLRINSCASIFAELLQYRYAYIKGEALSSQAYGAFGQRFSQDIDLLICRKDIRQVEKLFLNNGYSSKRLSKSNRVTAIAYSHQIPSLKYAGNLVDVNIDINFDIFWGEYNGRRVDIDKFLLDTIDMEIYGVRIKVLPSLKAMVQLILHHYKEMNSIYHLVGHNCINYNMFKDVYYLWKNNRVAISIDKLYTISRDYEIIPYVYYILYYTNQVFGDPELEEYVEVFRTQEGIDLLDYYGLIDKERKQWKVDFRTRLENENLYNLIKNDLTNEDIEKIERNRRIFG